MSYTREQTEKIIRIYENNPTRETVEELAEKYEKSVKSIIWKLSREGVYRREVYRSKTGELPVTKVEIVSNICDYLGLEVEHMEGLEKAPKAVLQKLVAGLQRGLNIREEFEWN